MEEELKPGSSEAVAKGCSCPVLDNARGKGYMGQEGVYCINTDCVLHGLKFEDTHNEN